VTPRSHRLVTIASATPGEASKPPAWMKNAAVPTTIMVNGLQM
jgi:hypothetical protein